MSELLPGNLRKVGSYIKEAAWVRTGTTTTVTSDSDPFVAPFIYSTSGIGSGPDAVSTDFVSTPDPRSANSLQYGARRRATRDEHEAIMDFLASL